MRELEFYVCETCGNLVETVNKSFGQLVCCNIPMKKLEPNTVDAATEKHVPVGTFEDNKLKVTVGSTLHPMTEEHYIKFICIATDDGKVQRAELKPDQVPEAEFDIGDSTKANVYAYCNLHGLWKVNISR